MGRGMGLVKRRIRGEVAGAEDGELWSGRVSVHAVNRGGVAQGAASRDGRGGRAATRRDARGCGAPERQMGGLWTSRALVFCRACGIVEV